jgi:hypothetical protein
MLMFRLVLRFAVVALALLAWIVRLPAAWVEHVYSRGVYAVMQPRVTAVSNLVPFALLDILVAVALMSVIAAGVATVKRMFAGRVVAAIWRFVFGLATAAALVYLAFLVMWGINYQRLPLVSTLEFNSQAARPDAVRDLAGEAVQQLNRLHDRAHSEGFADWNQLSARMGRAFVATIQSLAPGAEPLPGVPKWSLFSYYFDLAGISGMTDPFALEVLVDRDLLPFERPFVTGHEWAHLAGYADEGEANFIGWLICVNGGTPEAYSGWLYLYAEAFSQMPRSDRPALMRLLAPGPRADLAAIAERSRRVHPALRSFSWRVYDHYLKANRVSQGIASYDRVLVLVLGTRFERGWRPVLRK